MFASKLSTPGCSICKSQKKKCDRTSPNCLRCINSGKACPGYPDEAAIRFRDMTKISERKVKLRTTGRDRDKSGKLFPNGLSVDFDGPSKSQLDAFQRLRIGLQGKVTRSVSTNWEEIAVPRFFADYVSQSDVLSNGNFHFLPDIYSQRESTTHFDEALRAVAFMSLAKQLSQDDLSVEARKLYGSAIKRVATKLRNVEEAVDDTIIGSSFLFSLFEIISVKEVPKGFWNVPPDLGRISLLRARGRLNFSTSPALNLLSSVLVHNLIKCLASHIDPPEELLTWIDQSNPRDVDRFGPCAQLLKYSWEIAKFCAAAQVLFDSTRRDEQWVLNLLQLVTCGIVIDKKCEQWGDSTFKISIQWS